MERRDFLKAMGLAGGFAALGCETARTIPTAAASEAAAATMAAAGTGANTESRRAWGELLQLFATADVEYLGKKYGIERPADIADGHRFLMHALHSGIELWLEADLMRPRPSRIVSPTLKLLGDNPDAVYYGAPIHPLYRYRLRGNTGGAVYTSLTIEGGNADGHYPKRVAATLNDTQFDVAPDGSFEVILGPDEKGRNRLTLAPDAGTFTSRHYFENVKSAANDPSIAVNLTIEPMDELPPPPTPDDATIAASIRRVANYFRGVTLDQPPPGAQPDLPWVSRVPNQFEQPQKWDTAAGGFGAVDNAYGMGPYVVMPDQALVIRGRWPRARFANVVIWNRYMQTYDYVNRQVSLNRKQTVLERDGSFKMVLAHADPGHPNWIDLEGRVSGLVFWRFQLPREKIVTPKAEVVPLASLRG